MVSGPAGPALAKPSSGELSSPAKVGVTTGGWTITKKSAEGKLKVRWWVLDGAVKGKLRISQTQLSRGDTDFRTPEDLSWETRFEAIAVSDGAGGEVLAGGTRCQKFTKGKVCVTAQSDGRPLWVRPPGSSEIVSVYAVGAQSKRGFAYAAVSSLGDSTPADLKIMISAVKKGAISASKRSW